MPALAGARVACMGSAVIQHAERAGRENVAQRRIDGLYAGARDNLRTVWSVGPGLKGNHGACEGVSRVVRRLSQSAWLIMKTNIIAVVPITLKLTQVASL